MRRTQASRQELLTGLSQLLLGHVKFLNPRQSSTNFQVAVSISDLQITQRLRKYRQNRKQKISSTLRLPQLPAWTTMTSETALGTFICIPASSVRCFSNSHVSKIKRRSQLTKPVSLLNRSIFRVDLGKIQDRWIFSFLVGKLLTNGKSYLFVIRRG